MSRSSWEINLEEGLEINPEHIKKVCQCRRRVFSTEEDQLIADLVSSQQFTNWHEVAQKLHGRTARQCRDRWTNYLSPSNSFAPWTHEEDELIVKKVNEIGTKWSTIAKFIKGRSDNTIKNRWYSGLKKNCIVGSNGLYILKATNEKQQTTNKSNQNFIIKNPSEGKSTMRVKASPQKQKSKFASSSPSSQDQEDTNQYPITSPQKAEPQLPFTQAKSELLPNNQLILNKCSQGLSHRQETAFLLRQQDPTIQYQYQQQQLQQHYPQQIQPQYQVYQQITAQDKSKEFQVSQLLQASLQSIHQPMFFPPNLNQSLFYPTNMNILHQPYQQESQAFHILSNQTIPSQFQNSQQQQQLIKPQHHQSQQKQKQYLFPEMEMEMDTETNSQAEDNFWDRQIFNQVNDMNKDPFQIPELFGEWF